ncbi:MAG TPA: amidohydrolase, partial [Candidatus Olsenella avistercoris]|nr:amidohydrolase [Candidatus Olsenella avistercoris]
FVFTHVCGREFGTTCIELVRDIPNFSVETSANEEMDILREAVRVLGSERVVFGTDWPYKPTNIEVDKILELGLSDEELENVFWRNAQRIWDTPNA